MSVYFSNRLRPGRPLRLPVLQAGLEAVGLALVVLAGRQQLSKKVVFRHDFDSYWTI